MVRWFTEYSETGENQWLSYFFTGDIVYTSEDEPMPVFTITALPEGYEERADKRARFASTIAASFYYKDDEALPAALPSRTETHTGAAVLFGSARSVPAVRRLPPL
mgnify:CR=1 FL=1